MQDNTPISDGTERVPFPNIPEPLINSLNELFPERTAELNWTDREIWYYAGQRQLVRFLNNQFEQQNENILRQSG